MAPDCTPFERQLIEGCRNGSPQHQEMFYKHFYGFTMAIALRYHPARQEAGSVVNDSFMKVFDRIDRYAFDETFKGWLRRIVVNTALDHYRKLTRHAQALDPEQADSQAVALEDSVISQLTAEDILNLLQHLPDHYRMVFNLYEIEGYSHDEIARQLNLSVSSSRVYLVRAKEKLARLVKNYFPNHNERFYP
ncbi:RNA polymerase sigma factor [Larkinella humicola]|uniref:Sigma-70 family RNA polymerase sigma factor n=1 Tax=Larkinella humicola TaxID=2607654 RepID=A0A5N1J7C0_9BACT|nr:sigma-70 family RNA polymerase sigma factor [Larkinella humicola]KAA9346681.1 sigma-70 family RNA polymerase sigma factor [Larkinella humicola]